MFVVINRTHVPPFITTDSTSGMLLQHDRHTEENRRSLTYSNCGRKRGSARTCGAARSNELPITTHRPATGRGFSTDETKSHTSVLLPKRLPCMESAHLGR